MYSFLLSLRDYWHSGPRPSSERGVTVVEYAIMLVLIGIAVAGSSPGVRDAIVNTFNVAADTLNNAATP